MHNLSLFLQLKQTRNLEKRMNTGGEGEGEEEEKTLSAESMCKSCLILQLTDKKLAKEHEHRRRRRRRRRRRALHFAKSTHNFVCSPTQTDKKLVKEDRHRRKKKKKKKKKKKRLHLWNPCTIHVCSLKNSRKLQKKEGRQKKIVCIVLKGLMDSST